MPAPFLLALEHADRLADDGTPLLSDINFRISAGERVCVRGRSGAGKSLLLRALAALDPLVGQHLYRGRPVGEWGIPTFRSQVIYLGQTPSFPRGSVAEALREPFQFHVHQGRTFDHQIAVSCLQEFGQSASFLDKETTELSGGESSLAAIARALLLMPTLLLLDEPSAAMDAETTERLERCLRVWVAKPERAYVWITHQNDQEERVADRTIQMAEGRIISDG